MSDTTAAPSRGRQSRDKVEQARRERRYQPGTDAEGVNLHLWVDESKLDRENFQYRWVSDVHDRVRRLEQKDWDLVAEQDVGFTIDRSGDIQHSAGRENVRMRLMRKYKDWFQDDQNAKQRRIDDQMRRAATGEEIINGKGRDEGGGLRPEHAYMPKTTNEL